jgi:probable rRNA maturation factor
MFESWEEWSDLCLAGDIVISIDRAKAQADEYGHSLRRELGFLFVHGVLHLMGYDHETTDEEKEMRTLQEQILAECELLR